MVEQYRLGTSIDNVKRLSVEVTHRLSLADLACVITADSHKDLRRAGNVDLALEALLPTRRAAVKLAQRYLSNHGEVGAGVEIVSNPVGDLLARVQDRINELWSE